MTLLVSIGIILSLLLLYFSCSNSTPIWTASTLVSPNVFWKCLTTSSDGFFILAAANPGGIFASTDLGRSFQETAAPNTASWRSVIVSSTLPRKIWAASGVGIYSSLNEGRNWTILSTLSSSFWSQLCMSYDGSIVVAAANPGEVYISSDGGLSWTATSLGSAKWISLDCAANGSVVAAASESDIFVSSDRGSSWFRTPQAGLTIKRVVVAASASVMAVILRTSLVSADIYLSYDLGRSWGKSNSPSFNWYGISVSDDGLFFAAVSYANGIYLSTNSGLNWTESTTKPISAKWTAVSTPALGFIVLAATDGGGIYYLPRKSIRTPFDEGKLLNITIISILAPILGVLLIMVAFIFWKHPEVFSYSYYYESCLLPVYKCGTKISSPIVIEQSLFRINPSDVFLSYSWENDIQGRNNQVRVARVNSYLKSKGLTTWFDDEQLKGSLIDINDVKDETLRGVEGTKVMIAFLTDIYMRKIERDDGTDINRFEFSLAVNTKGIKYIIPVVMEESRLNTDMWYEVVSSALGAKSIIDLTSDEELLFNRSCDTIVETIRKLIPPQPSKSAGLKFHC